MKDLTITAHGCFEVVLSLTRIVCPACHSELGAPNGAASVRCPQCQAIFTPGAQHVTPEPVLAEALSAQGHASSHGIAALGAPATDPGFAEFVHHATIDPSVSQSGVRPALPATGGISLQAILRPPRQAGELGWLGNYRVLQILGRGGMGMVFQAEDTQLRRLVALKVMLPHYAEQPVARDRFQREARTAAAIDHDHIVTIFQVGEDNGVPYLAMPLLRGESLADRLVRDGKLPLPEAIRVARQIAEGLAAAHELGLIHRDVKPANVWLEARGEVGGEPQRRPEERKDDQTARVFSARVKLLDFGLARAAAGEEDRLITQSGMVLGTPAYMSPEQGRGQPVDPRTDLFSLGCVLYQMVTGQLPFKGADTLAQLSALAMDTPEPPRQKIECMPPALDELILKLLAKNPADRPTSAAAVASALRSLENAQDLETITHISSLGRRLEPSQAGKRRRRVLVIAAALALTCLAIAGYLWWPSNGAGRKLEHLAKYRVDPFAELDAAAIPLSERFPWQPKELVAVAGEHRQRHWGTPRQVVVHPDGKIVATCGMDGVRFWDLSSQAEVNVGPTSRAGLEAPASDTTGPARLAGPTEQFGWTQSLAFSPDGKRLFTRHYNSVRQWDIEDGRVVRHVSNFPVAGDQGPIAVSRDGKTLATVGQFVENGKSQFAVQLWSLDEPALKLQHTFRGATSFSFSLDGKLLALSELSSDDEKKQVVRVVSLAELPPKERAILPGFPGLPRFAPDGRLATCDGAAVHLWDLGGKEPKQVLELKEAASAVFSPDRRWCAVPWAGTELRLWELQGAKATRKSSVQFSGAHDALQDAAFSLDGKTLVTIHQNGAVAFWDVAGSKPSEKLPLRPAVTASHQPVFVSDDGAVLLLGGMPWELAGPLLQRYDFPLKVAADWPVGQALSPQGKLWVGSKPFGPEFGIVRLADGQHLGNIPAGDRAAFLGETVLAVGGGGAITLWDVGGTMPREITRVDVPKGTMRFLQSAGSNTLLSSAEDGLVRLWQFEKGQLAETARVPMSGPVANVALAPDGQMLAIAGTDGQITLWKRDADKLAKGRELIIGVGNPGGLAFSPDGQRLAASGQFGHLVVWDVASGRKAWETKLPYAAPHLAFAPDGRHLVTANANGTAYVLRLPEN